MLIYIFPYFLFLFISCSLSLSHNFKSSFIVGTAKHKEVHGGEEVRRQIIGTHVTLFGVGRLLPVADWNPSRRVYATATTTAEAVKQSHKVEEKVSSLSIFTGGKGLRGSNSQKESAGSWIPDPITGYYRPVNYVDNVDAAELRKTHHC
ncbi:Late embryogenesis abundant protein [Carex littledalei]|uniref:Late embryogenesis abundant protein n=1 Tax=Carex littledalei TaxID=544730 RepID=A0A833VK02_9POAL|nr:Late embryogenesis abundant protein [Carex littledalei]